jgi:hypothetical protein
MALHTITLTRPPIEPRRLIMHRRVGRARAINLASPAPATQSVCFIIDESRQRSPSPA